MSHLSRGAGTGDVAPQHADDLAKAIRFIPETHYWVTRDAETGQETVHYPAQQQDEAVAGEHTSPQQQVLDLVHPEDREMVVASARAAVLEKRVITRRFRLLDPATGRYRQMEDTVVPHLPSDGELLRFGISRDITNRLSAEARFLTLSRTIEQTSESVMLLDRNGLVQYVNAAFEAMTGFGSDELAGQHHDVLSDEIGAPYYQGEHWLSALRGQAFRGRFLHHRKDGTPYYQEESVTPIRDGAGEIIQIVSLGREALGDASTVSLPGE